MGRARTSIAFEFIGIVLLILAGGQMMLGMWFILDQRALHSKLMLKRAELSAAFIAREYADEVKDGGPAEAKGFRGLVMEDEDILSAKVTAMDGKVLVRLEFPEKKPEEGLWNPIYLPCDNIVRQAIFSDGSKIGELELVYCSKSANAALLKLIYKPAIAQSIIFAFALYAVYYCFRRKVGEPIDVLCDRIERITGGDLGVSVPQMGDSEIGMIARGLKFMVESQRAAAKRLNATAEKVSSTVRTLEGTFESFTHKIKKQTVSTDEIALSLQKAGESQKRITEIVEELLGFSSENVTALLEVKAMSDEIVSSMDTLFKASESSYNTVAEMAQTSKVVAGNSSEILSSVETTSASVEEVIASVREVEKSAKDSSALAEDVRIKAAKLGVNTVAEAVEGMKAITEKVGYSMQVVRKLHDRSRDVEMILSVIREVTEQTNLLSLNAAILAEKAGEYGKGFAVVSGEMRALSGRTAAYTKEIAAIVKTIQSEINDVVSSIDAGMAMVNEGGEKVYRVGVTMSDILEAAFKSAQMTRTIERATEEQVKALDHVEQAMIDISNMASGMAHTMEEQIKGSGYMLERVGEVREIAETTKRGMDEQAAGSGAISRNFEIANERMTMINSAVSAQQKISEGIVASVEEIRYAGSDNIRQVQEVTTALQMLLAEINSLKEEMQVFRVG